MKKKKKGKLKIAKTVIIVEVLYNKMSEIKRAIVRRDMIREIIDKLEKDYLVADRETNRLVYEYEIMEKEIADEKEEEESS